MIKKLGYFILFLFAIQLIRPTKNNKTGTNSTSINYSYDVPKNVESILSKSCYDCHSNSTNYLWYHEIAPISWLVSSHIKDGKKHLNFDTWGNYNREQKVSIFEDFKREIEHNKMPMSSYVLMHPEARLSDTEKQNLIQWFKDLEKAEKQINSAEK